jgi:membrane protein DedA with SNARE-associated domain
VLALINVTHLVSTYGYAAIFVLSVLQSCCIPTSSELTMGFAGVLAAEGKLSLPAVILVGATGELVGAYIAWFIGRYAGRSFVDRYGKYILLTHHDLDRAEGWYHRHGNWGVFGGRLIPVVRNFVALPAGVAEFPLVRFGVLTFLGSLIWDGAMALIGYGVGGSYHRIMKGFAYAGYVLVALAVVALAVVIYHRYRSYKAATAGGGMTRRAPVPAGTNEESDVRTATPVRGHRNAPVEHPAPVADAPLNGGGPR